MSSIQQVNLKKTRSHKPIANPISSYSNSLISSINDKKLSEIIVQLMKNNEALTGRLQEVQNELSENSKSMEIIKKLNKINPMDMSENKLHFAFLFSSPLIREANGKTQTIMQLNCLSEVEDILGVLSNLDYEMRYRICVATREYFRSTVTDCPIALHFSGHGIENNRESLGHEAVLFKGKGNILLLEDGNGKSSYFFEEDLRTLVDISKNKFEVVFVSSCHSEFAGRVFLNAGAKHVICIRGEEKISDKASLRFSKVFYETLFGKKYNVCDSFHTAKEEVRNDVNGAEANKFLLFTQESDGCNYGKKHKCSQILNLKPGKLINVEKEPLFNFIPSNVDGFIDRQQEMHSIINMLHENRIVSILGPPGIGKTSIARNLSNYLKTRRKYKDGIIYVRLRGCESSQMFMSRLSLCIRSCCQDIDPDEFNFDEEEDADNIDVLQKHDSVVNRKEYMKDSALNVLKAKEALLILDNWEDPLENDHERFVFDLENVLEYWGKLKMLLTSRRPLNNLVYNKEQIFNLNPLPKESALKLLISKSPRIINNNEILDLLNCDIPIGSKIRQSQMNSGNFGQKDLRLLNHPFTEILGGHPQAISLAAPLLKDNTLKELFLAFWDSNVLDVIDDNSVGQNQYTSLRVSLELSIEHVRRKNEKALNLFGLIGLLPWGANKDEITEMWGDTSWKPLKDELVRASLLTFKSDTIGSFVYNMLPFMSVRANEILEEQDDLLQEFHLKCCRLCKDYCNEFYSSEKSIEDIQGLVSIESNIWACINRALIFNRDLKVQSESPTKTGDEVCQFVTPGNTETEVTRQSSDTMTDDSDLSDLLLDIEIYRSLSAETPSEEVKDSRSNLLQKFESQKELDSKNLFDEECLVIYYATNLIYMNKNEDALRAVSEYLQKPGISELGLANFYRIYAVLLMISIENQHVIASIKLFKKALKHYLSLGIMRGVAICQLGICKICHDRYHELMVDTSNEWKDGFIQQCYNLIQNAKKLFDELKYEDGRLQWVMIENSFKEKFESKDHLNIKEELSETESNKYSSMMHEDNSIMLKVIFSDSEDNWIERKTSTSS